MSEPLRDRPAVPDGYGAPEDDSGLLEWADVEKRLIGSEQYWMATTKPDDSPHVVPRWGVWLDSHLYYDGSPKTLHARNVVDNPACVLHLENGWEAVIVEGESKPADPPGLGLGARISEAMSSKYGDMGYSPGADAWEGPDAGGLMIFTPAKALAWFNFPHDMTRFRFN